MAQAVANVVTGQMYRFGDRRTGRRRYGAPQRSWPGADNKTWEKQGFPAAPQRELVLRIGGRAGDAGFPRARSSTRKRNEEGKPESHTASGRRAPRVDLTSLRASRPFASSLSLGAASGGAHAIKTGTPGGGGYCQGNQVGAPRGHGCSAAFRASSVAPSVRGGRFCLRRHSRASRRPWDLDV